MSKGIGALVLIPVLAALIGAFSKKTGGGGGGGSSGWDLPTPQPLPPPNQPPPTIVPPLDPEDPYYPYQFQTLSANVPTNKPTGAILMNIDVPPANTTPQVTPSGTWKWITPNGVIESRPPSESEREMGSCPEIPNIWSPEMGAWSTGKYCKNPDCPSNKPQYEAVVSPNSPNILPPTPALLEAHTDAAGKVSFWCPVCRTYQNG